MIIKNLHYEEDYSLIDGNRIIRNHKTEHVLEEFLVAGLEKIKVLAMNVALTEEQADTLLDCVIDEHFAFGGDMKGFADLIESIGNFLDYYLDRMPQTIKLPDEDTVPDTKESFPNLELMAEAMNQPF